MLYDGISLVEGSSLSNAAVDHGSVFPANADTGELFFRSDVGSLYVYDGITWMAVGAPTTDASVLTSGTVGTARLGSGTASSTTFLRGDQTWQTISAGSSAAIDLTGTTLASNVVTSSLTSVGTLGSLTVTGNVTSNATPTATTHLTTKQYVDNLIQGLSWKNPVRAATTGNITLSGTQTIDGVAVVAGDRVLVKNQTNGNQNGAYVVSAGAWTRPGDMDGSPDAGEVNGAALYVTDGTTNADTTWTQTSTISVVGSQAMTFVQLSGGLVNATSLAGTTLASNVVTSSLTSVGTITAGTWSGTLGAISGASLTNLNATNLASGTVAAARLGSGLASSTTFLAGDSTWQTISVTPAAGSLTGTTLAANVVSSSLTSFGEVTQLAIGSNANVTTSGATGALRLGYLNSAISSTQDAFVCWANGTQALVTGGGSSANGTLVLASRNVSNAGIVLATGGSAKLSIDSAGATTVYGTLTSKAGLTVTSDASLVANGANGSLQLGWLNAAITSTGDAYVAIGGVGASSALSPGQLQGTLILSARNGNSAGVSIATGSTSRLFINSSGAFGIGGANYGSSGQVLTSNGSAAAPTWGAVTAIATQIPRAATFTGTSADIGKRIVISAAPTVPAGVYTPGDVFSFYNNTSVTITIIQGAGLTMHQDGNTNTGNRSLAPYGTCMIWFDSASVCVISGSVT